MDYLQWMNLVDSVSDAMSRLNWLWFDHRFPSEHTNEELVEEQINTIYLSLSEQMKDLTDAEILNVCIEGAKRSTHKQSSEIHKQLAEDMISHLFVVK